jgi:hypothetical protein
MIASGASAANLLSEPFNYPNGSLVGQGSPPWANHSGTVGQLQVNNGEAVVVEAVSTTASEDVNKPFGAQAASAKTYFHFLMIVRDTTSLASANYFAHTKVTANTTNFRARIHIARDSVNAGHYKIGIAASSVASNDSASVVYYPGSYAIGQKVLVTSSYNAANGESELWVDASSENDPKVSRKRADAAGDPIAEYALRQGGSATHTLTVLVDNLGVGTSFNDARAAASAVPSMSQWGLLLLSGLLVLTGAAFVVRRRNLA